MGTALSSRIAILSILRSAVSTLFQCRCYSCEMRTDFGVLCPDCSSPVEIGTTICFLCGQPQNNSVAECGKCVTYRPKLAAIRSSYILDEASRKWVHLVKYRRNPYALSLHKDFPLNDEFIEQVKGAVVMPVPMHPLDVFKRGFNQSSIIAKWLGHRIDGTVNRVGLQKIRQTASQSTLGREGRERNLVGAFCFRAKEVPSKVVIVDDIFTTGETLSRCAQELRRCGVKLVYGWTLFRKL